MKDYIFKHLKNIIGISLISFFIIYILIQYLVESNNSKLLENSAKVKGIIIETHTPEVIHGSYYGIFTYNIGQKKYRFKELGDFSLLSVHDTVLIEYAIKDNSVARVVDKFYMTKHKHLKNN